VAVIAGHSRSKNGVASLAYDPAIQRLRQRTEETANEANPLKDGLPGQARQ
jgi:hypothetical protein